MTAFTLIIRSLRHYWRTHASVFAGTALSVAVLVGALLVGSSVTYTLRQFALERLGRTDFALQLRNRFCAEGLAARLERETGAGVAPILQLLGIAIRQDSAGGEGRQVNQIQVLGVDRRFWSFSDGPDPALKEGEIAVCEKLANRLDLKAGDELAVRIYKPNLLPRDAPLSSHKERPFVRGVFTVKQIVPDSHLGRFSLAANQTAPNNVFVDLAWLQGKAGLPGRADILLVHSGGPRPLSLDGLSAAVRRAWRIEDSGMALRALPDLGLVQLESDRVFLDPEAARGALQVENAAGVITYLVNSIRKGREAGGRATPYAFVTACAPSANPRLGPVPADMPDDGIIINRWLADQLDARAGDELTLSYYELSASNDFIEKARVFKVRAIVEMDALAGERKLVPAFPGLTDVDSCAEWDIGMPMNEAGLKDTAGEADWKQYRQTPKAFVTLAAGRAMWANRFGELTAVRYPLDGGAGPTSEALSSRVDPSLLGLSFQAVRATALKAVGEAEDFGGLFLGMSFFLIVAALMLTGLLFVFGIQHRAPEAGLLLAVGYTPGRVRRLMLMEAGAVACAGTIAGAFMGTAYTRLLLWGLARYWRGAVAGAPVEYHADAGSVAVGAAAGFVCALAAIAVAGWRQSKHPAPELLTGDFTPSRPPTASKEKPGRVSLALAVVGGLAAVGIVARAAAAGSAYAVPAFFAAGAILLVSALGLDRCFLLRLGAETSGRFTVGSLGVRNIGRRPGRSLTVAGLLACGCFMVLAVSSMQEDVTAGAGERRSGTGGFALFGESTLPAPRQLDREFRLSDERDLGGVQVVPLKVYDGDDASCFNLNRAQTPRLLGVNTEEFTTRHAFLPGGRSPDIWKLLDQEFPDGSVPALAGDADTAMWGLKKAAAGKDDDILVYKDEHGRRLNVRLVGKLPMRLSVFQGTVLISDKAFTAHFPSEDGYRMFLVDVPRGREVAARDALSRRMERVGLNVTTTSERLVEFYSVQKTYLRMFLVLGGLGLVLGSAGMGIVVLRNVLERRRELAILRAVGFGRSRIRYVVLLEHALLLALGVAGGLASAAVAMVPSLRAPGADVPWLVMASILAGIVGIGLLWIVLAASWSTRSTLIAALRNE